MVCVCVCVSTPRTLYDVSKAHIGKSVHGSRLVLGEAHSEVHIRCCGESRCAVGIMVAGVTQQWTLPGGVTQCLSAVVLVWLGADHLHARPRAHTHRNKYFFEILPLKSSTHH